ncbi:MAG: hypothetical protein ACRD1X_18090 [Vicinamibacteria bacterium]
MVKRVGLQLVLAGAFLVALFAAARDANSGKTLNRSIYVPLKLDLCEHIEEAALYQDEMLVRRLPASQTIQFTFYPDLKRLLPEQNVFRVKGKELGGHDFDVRLTVTPADVFIADRHIDLHPEEQLKDLGHRMDIHYDPVTLKLNCRDFCPRETGTDRTAELSR